MNDNVAIGFVGVLIGLLLGVVASAFKFEATRTEDIIMAAVSCEPMGGLKHIQTGSKVYVTCNNGMTMEFKSVVQEN